MKRQDVIDALNYFHGMGMIDNLHGDAEYYCKILIQFAATRCDITLEQRNLYTTTAMKYTTCNNCCYDILDDEGNVMEHECTAFEISTKRFTQ